MRGSNWNFNTSVLLVLMAFNLSPVHGAIKSADEYSDKPVQYFRMEVKLGSPDFAGLEAEWVPPALKNWISVFSGFTYLPIGHQSTIENGEVTEDARGGFDHFGLGTRFYFTGEGSGFYISMGYDRIAFFQTTLKTQSDKRDISNPTHIGSLQLGYKYIGEVFTYGFFGGYGYNFYYPKPTGTDKPLFGKGNWILAGLSIGMAFPFIK